MRKKIAAANWKMNLTLPQAENLIQEILTTAPSVNGELLICPPFPYLMRVKALVNDRPHFSVGAQNCATEKSGAYTGEVSAEMLQSVGAQYVIIGHSERREYFGETGPMLEKKIRLAIASGLTPLFCCGEGLEIREKGKQTDFVARQLKESLFGLQADEIKKIVIAYEPIWAIGTGRTASPEQAQEMHAFIRANIGDQYGNPVAEAQTILYGGSCKPDNAFDLFKCPDVDGALIGGASLKADSFLAIASFL
jgi:triosephosphate isomerase